LSVAENKKMFRADSIIRESMGLAEPELDAFPDGFDHCQLDRVRIDRLR
jgi:hypothetical protein